MNKLRKKGHRNRVVSANKQLFTHADTSARLLLPRSPLIDLYGRVSCPIKCCYAYIRPKQRLHSQRTTITARKLNVVLMPSAGGVLRKKFATGCECRFFRRYLFDSFVYERAVFDLHASPQLLFTLQDQRAHNHHPAPAQSRSHAQRRAHGQPSAYT